eukprot:13628182-Alexandrium_andersonii.AAC.1
MPTGLPHPWAKLLRRCRAHVSVVSRSGGTPRSIEAEVREPKHINLLAGRALVAHGIARPMSAKSICVSPGLQVMFLPGPNKP